jgi:hypothetical protein
MGKRIDIKERLEKYSIPEPNSGCYLWVGRYSRDGYGQVYYKGTQARAHRVAYLEHKEDIPEGTQVCHACDVPICINPSHLFLGTHKVNHEDCTRKGRRPYGDRAGSRKLSSRDIPKIKKLWNKGFYQQEIADMYGVHQTAISRILLGKTWSHANA